MFILSEFIKSNLINGVQNGSFSRERANILAVEYLSKGFLSTEDLQEINEATIPIVDETIEESEL